MKKKVIFLISLALIVGIILFPKGEWQQLNDYEYEYSGNFTGEIIEYSKLKKDKRINENSPDTLISTQLGNEICILISKGDVITSTVLDDCPVYDIEGKYEIEYDTLKNGLTRINVDDYSEAINNILKLKEVPINT